ncbi:hypothetical protein DM01DRAFT_1336334 [Hesseltinella vesiculosa]|uniref:LITAF domain-containing protein n=1 Tax=Hesseltinella vesiculosa TaxID=101127 RepID=A0A1X2GG90_9FUNG|nr:hypothetical protein DM01DRAFT_1336334 [Hesseltinella vesiculosa]
MIVHEKKKRWGFNYRRLMRSVGVSKPTSKDSGHDGRSILSRPSPSTPVTMAAVPLPTELVPPSAPAPHRESPSHIVTIRPPSTTSQDSRPVKPEEAVMPRYLFGGPSRPPPTLCSSKSSTRSSVPVLLSVTSASSYCPTTPSYHSSVSSLDDEDHAGADGSLRSAHSGSMIDDLSTRVYQYRFNTPAQTYYPRDPLTVAPEDEEDDASRFSFDPQQRPYPPSSIQSTTAGAPSYPSFFRPSFHYLRGKRKSASITTTRLPDFETSVYCSVCDKWIQSRLRYRSGAMVWLASFVL